MKSLLLLFAVLTLYAQQPNEKNTPSRPPRTPDYAGVEYGPFLRNDLDIYLAAFGPSYTACAFLLPRRIRGRQ